MTAAVRTSIRLALFGVEWRTLTEIAAAVRCLDLPVTEDALRGHLTQMAMTGEIRTELMAINGRRRRVYGRRETR